jgi:hypothetical protein
MSLTSPDLRVECPHCGTSYKAERLRVKHGPLDKAIMWCATCHQKLSVTPGTLQVEELGPRSWRTFWRRPKVLRTVLIYVVKALTDPDGR